MIWPLMVFGGTGLHLPAILAEEAGAPDFFIHPLCLEALLAADGDAPFVCEPELSQIPVEVREAGVGHPGQPPPAPFVSVEYPREGVFYAGYIGYREAARWTSPSSGSEFALLQITTSGGGTGHFSSLARVERTVAHSFVAWWSIPGGDRCNDGMMRVEEFSGHEVSYSTSATPFRLLNPVDRSNWRMLEMHSRLSGWSGEPPATLFDWQPYRDVANSASSCAGSILYRINPISGKTDVVGVSVDTDAFLSETQGDKQACINQWLRETMVDLKPGEGGWIPLEEWLPLLGALGDRCLQ